MQVGSGCTYRAAAGAVGEAVGMVREELGHIEADAARTDDGDRLADRLLAREHVDIRDDGRVVEILERARHDARRKHHAVAARVDEALRVDACRQPEIDRGGSELVRKVA